MKQAFTMQEILCDSICAYGKKQKPN